MKEAAYDDVSNTVTICDELDHKTDTVKLTGTYTYNYLDKVKTAIDSGGHTYSYEYDPLGRPTKLFNPDSTFKEIQYNDAENIITVFDENYHKKEYHHDWYGNLVWVKEYTSTDCYLTQYTYDNLGNLTSFTDANGNTTFYSYDSLFGLTQVVYPDLTTKTFSYDSVGNLLQKTDSRGTTTFTYNSIYQLIGILNPDQSVVSFEYDENGNRISMTDSEGQTSSIYDDRNRLLSETRTIEGVPYTMNYQYDAASRLVSLTYPDQSVVTYEYDALNRLVSIPGYAHFTYNTDSLLATMTYNNGAVTTYEYSNCCHRILNICTQENGTDLLDLNFQYDPAGNILHLDYGRMKDQWVESSETFSYDWLNRLVSAQGEYGSLTYSYDPVGNRLSQNEVTYIYNSMNELLSSSDGTQFTYDENGNRIQKTKGSDTWVYSYDYADRLKRVEKNGVPLGEYVYDGDGKRIQVQENGETTTYVYSGLNVLYEENTTGAASYIYGPAGRLAKKTVIQGETSLFYYHTDHLGSTRLVTDEFGNTVTDAVYTPFGESSVSEESYLFTGKERDSTGLYFFGARYYDPEVGRFMTEDPLAGEGYDPQSLNRYSYCLNSPLNMVDPLGLQPGGESACWGDGAERRCIDFLEKGWGLYDGNGNLITSSEEVQDLLDKAKTETNPGLKQYYLLQAMVRILQALGYDVTDENIKAGGAGLVINFQVNGVDVEISVVFDVTDDGIEGHTEQRGGRKKTYKEKTISVQIYFGPNNKNWTFAQLFHSVGHEMVHVQQLSSGRYYEWKEQFGDVSAFFLAESEAYRWNLMNLPYVNYPGAWEKYSNAWLLWTLAFYNST